MPDFQEVEPRSPLSRERWRRAPKTAGEYPGLQAITLPRFLQKYSGSAARADLRAAINVALIDFPLAIAFAAIAGLPLSMGLFAAAVASIVGPWTTGSRHLLLGPTNAVAALTLSGMVALGMSAKEAAQAIPTLLVLVAGLLVLGALFHVAALTRFISRSVITGYLVIAAITIIANQLHPLLGLDSERVTAPFDLLIALASDLPALHWPSLMTGAVTCLIYLACKRTLKWVPAISLTLVATILLQLLPLPEAWRVTTLAESGLNTFTWQITAPSLDWELIKALLPLASALAFFSLIETATTAKSLAARSGESINLHQQTFSLGIAGAATALLGGMPVSGSPTRSRLNQDSGSVSPLSSIYSGLLILLGILLLGPALGALPNASLAVVIILVGISLFHRANLRLILGATRGDAVVFLVTASTGLFLHLTTAIFAGTTLSIMLFLQKAALPQLKRYAFTRAGHERLHPANHPAPALVLLHVEGDLFFGSSDIFFDQARRICADESIRVLIVRLRDAHNIDATCAAAFLELIEFSRERGRYVIVSGIRPEVAAIFRDSGLLRTLGAENCFAENPDNPNESTSRALRRARELIGQMEVEIRLYLPEDDSGAATN